MNNKDEQILSAPTPDIVDSINDSDDDFEIMTFEYHVPDKPKKVTDVNDLKSQEESDIEAPDSEKKEIEEKIAQVEKSEETENAEAKVDADTEAESSEDSEQDTDAAPNSVEEGPSVDDKLPDEDSPEKENPDEKSSDEEIVAAEISDEEIPDEENKKKKTGKKHPVIHIILSALTGILLTLAALVFFGVRYMFNLWAGGTVQELLFTMTGNLEGVNSDMIISGVLQVGVPALLILIAYILIMVLFVRKRSNKIFHLINTLIALLSIVVIVWQSYTVWTKLDLKAYLVEQGIIEIHNSATKTKEAMGVLEQAGIEAALEKAEAEEKARLELEQRRATMTFIDANYVDPAEIDLIAPDEKRNLICIYLESMEMTYSDTDNGGAYSTNYIPELTTLSEENENFSGTSGKLNGAEVLTYSTWTMAGIFAQTAGLPLDIPIGRNQMNTQSTFLPSVTGLGDILEAYGYNQAFQCGSDVAFGGRQAYFTTHGGFDFFDLNYSWQNGEIPNGRKVWWGYEDEYLFDFAKQHILDMAAKDEPFNYTMLTVDTHYPDGYMCELCGRDLSRVTAYGHYTDYGNVMACSSKQVYEFIQWIQQQDFYENTTVVLLGDHLTMDTNFCSDIDRDYTRKTYVCYMNSAVEPELTTAREYVTEDSFPTILASLGFEIPGNKLALGTNLFSSTPTLIEEYGYDDMNQGIVEESEVMDTITSDVNLSEAASQYNVYNAHVSVTNVDKVANAVTIEVGNITTTNGLSGVAVGLCTEDNKSDLVTVNANHIDDTTYSITIYLDNYNFDPEKDITIEAYIYDWGWKSHLVDRTVFRRSDMSEVEE